ncbi:tetratricopeptide repeat protein [bacterium]|nr:tetratricopeptide repeat protein [bacterium]
MTMDNFYKIAFQHLRKVDDPASLDRGMKMLEGIYEQDPNNTKACFEYAGGWDSIGQEDKAAVYYQKVKMMGVETLPMEDQPCFYVQYGSTLRNLKKFDQANEVFNEGIKVFPDFLAIKLFRALNLYSMGIEQEKNKNYIKKQLTQARHHSVLRYLRSLKKYLELIDC